MDIVKSINFGTNPNIHNNFNFAVYNLHFALNIQ